LKSLKTTGIREYPSRESLITQSRASTINRDDILKQAALVGILMESFEKNIDSCIGQSESTNFRRYSGKIKSTRPHSIYVFNQVVYESGVKYMG
jgi:hypothetical protein